MTIDDFLGLWRINAVERFIQQAVAYRISKYQFGLEIQHEYESKIVGKYLFKDNSLTDCDNLTRIGKCTKDGSIIWIEKETNLPVSVWKRYGITGIFDCSHLFYCEDIFNYSCF